MNFLTVEDVNGVMFNNQGFWWYTADTALIDPNVSAEFSNVKLDFLTISKEKVDTYNYKFTVKVDNSLWTGGAYIINQREMPNAPQIQFTDDGFTVILRQSVIDFPAKIVLYMGITELHNVKERMRYYLDNNSVMNLPLNDLANKRVFVRMWGDIFVHGVTLSLTEGFNEVRYNNTFVGFILVNILKTDFQFNCNQSLSLGKINKVYLGTNADYKPNGDMVGDNEVSISVKYKNSILPVNFDGTDYYFNLDLRNVDNVSKIKFDVIVESNNVLNYSKTRVVLDTFYETVKNFQSLLTKCNSSVDEIIRLGANITFTSSITISSSIKIIGNGYKCNLQGHNFILNEDVTFKLENVWLDNGGNAIIQSENTNLDIVNCKFTNCSSSKHNGLGSCIYCKTSIENIEVSNDFVTNIENTIFENNTNAIFHGGELIIDNCKLHNTIKEAVNRDSVAFLYQNDGECVIRNSVFDLDYDFNDFCSNQETIGFGQALVMCGENAVINGANYSNLQADNSLPFFDDFNNVSRVFCKYYYPQVSECVFVSPLPNYESKSVCHAVSGINWIFKNNVQLTKVSSGNENRYNFIDWED